MFICVIITSIYGLRTLCDKERDLELFYQHLAITTIITRWASFPQIQTYIRSHSHEPEKERDNKKRGANCIWLSSIPQNRYKIDLGKIKDQWEDKSFCSTTHGNYCSKKVPGFIHKPSCSYTGLPHFAQDFGASWGRSVTGFEPQSRCFNCCDIQHAHIIWEIVYPEVVCIQETAHGAPHTFDSYSLPSFLKCAYQPFYRWVQVTCLLTWLMSVPVLWSRRFN